MGAPITEYYVEQVIKTGLELVRNTPSKIDDLLSGFNEGLFIPLFGKKVIAQVKDFILNRRIAVIHGINLVPENLPCYSISLLPSYEDHTKAAFDDFDSAEMNDITPDAIASFDIDSYDSVNGFCAVSDSVDTSVIYIGAIIKDSADTTFEILGPIISDEGKKGFYIVTDAAITTGAVQLISQIDQERVGNRAVPVIDRVQVGVHCAEDTNLTKYLYYLLNYWFFTRRVEIETAGYQLSKYIASDLTKEVNLLPDNVTSRYVTFEFLTWFKWQDDPWSAAGVTTNRILVAQDIWVKDDDTATGTTDE